MSSFNRTTVHAGRAKERKAVKLYMSDKHDANNLIAAEIILGDIYKYGGEGSGLALWADAFLARKERERIENSSVRNPGPAGV